ncbi:phospholipase D1 [Heterostelium album PN500]|uniref:phospholipase D n=1 Tax=Heterostelium pallidum (strain ATCC 26659 / Pp 5 / PN500) TaxID=670386 RepID=D3BQD9_HETP5|nr:phospholipase D1 [Heterostelium album PN500]EFA76359.1 phospholipase D1 [Heterostelium album PN500]|eukprot:XP_020428491.1 phospholipase D1 [Heterostelium album PN500]
MSESNNASQQQPQQQQQQPEIFQQITNFFDSLSTSFQNLSQPAQQQQPTTQQQQQNQQQQPVSIKNIPSNQSTSSSDLKKQLLSREIESSSTSSKSPKSPKSISPTSSQNQFPAFYQHSQKTLKELDERRLLLIEHLKSVRFNLATQAEDDPISYIKIRMELTKRKTSLEQELRSLDEVLSTKSLSDLESTSSSSTTMDGITNFLGSLISPTSSNSLNQANHYHHHHHHIGGGGHHHSHHHHNHHHGQQVSLSPPDNYSYNQYSQLNHDSSLGVAHHALPNSIIPTGTPIDNPDPNQPRFPQRDNINVKIYVDCDDYFAASALAIENATREVFITAWFLSPEVFLIRYPSLDPKYRMDNLLCRKAKQGVKIFIILWDETKIATFKGSKRCKEKLEELHHNIKVIKHPPFTPIYWSHHQKTLIVDQEIAFVGGVDFCFGRYDTWSHNLIDVHATLWPGKDYYNPVLGDMGDILSPHDDSIDRKKVPRMPWHDVMIGVNGLAARDVALNFILRWNHHKDDYYPQLYFNTTPMTPIGTSQCQLLRSMDEWSGGGRNERSIHTAYIQAIEDADHYIYIENQNFVSTHAPGVWNQISAEIVKRIRRAIRKREVFRVVILLPAQQDGRFQEETHIRGLMHWQFLTLNRTENSMVRQLKREFPNEDLSEYIGFYSLRTHACLEGVYVSEQIYVHSKLMIIDDRVVIVGSANINDRSFIGERDSELAFIVRDENDRIKTRMNGKEYWASRFAYNLRLRLWKEHIGLLPDIDHPPLVQNSNSLSASLSFSGNGINSGNNNSNNTSNNNTSNSNNSSTNNFMNDINRQPPLTISSQYRIPKQSHHRSSSYQGTKSFASSLTSSTSSTSIAQQKLSGPTTPNDSPQDSPRGSSSTITTSTTVDINSITKSISVDNISVSTSSLPPTSNTTTATTTTPSNNNILTPEHLIIEDYNTPLDMSTTNIKSNNNNNNNNNIVNTNNTTTTTNNTPTTTSTLSTSSNNTTSTTTTTTTINNNNINSGDSSKVFVVSEIDSPKLKPISVSSLHSEGIEESIIGGIDLTDPVDSTFYLGVWIATAASNTRIYDTVFPAIAKNSIRTIEEFNQNLKKPVSNADCRLLSEVRGNLIYHPLDFLADEDIQPTFLFTDDLFQ